MNLLGINIEWLGHACFRIKHEETIIYLDPFKLKNSDEADFIFITHEHFDHCSVEDVRKITKKETVIITVADCQSKLKDAGTENVKIVSPGKSLDFERVKVKAVRAYNKNKQFHPKANDWVGFILEMGCVKVYHSGDTDLIDEMKNIKADITLLPVSGTYVMTAEEAAKAAEMIKPKFAIPMHYGAIVGKKEDAIKFKSLCESKGISVVVFE